MLLRDAKDSNQIINYNISFDDESTKEVLEILDDCFSRRKIGLPIEESFLMHRYLSLYKLQSLLSTGENVSKGGYKDLEVYHYTFSDLAPKKSIIGNIDLGKEVKVSKTAITCSKSAIIAFIICHLDVKERSLFVSRLNPVEKTYLGRLFNLPGSERLSNLLGTVESIEKLLQKCQNFKEAMILEDIRLLEEIQYFKTVYSYSTLTPKSIFDDKASSNSILPYNDMECDDYQNISSASSENTAIVKKLTLEPKRIIQKQK